MKRFLGFALILLLLMFAGIFITWQSLVMPVSPKSQETQIFVVSQGWSVSQIARELKAAGLIKTPLAFQIITFKLGIRDKLQAGDFRLSPAMSLTEIAENLTHGTLDIWVTVPEGLRKEEIAQLIFRVFSERQAEFNMQEFARLTEKTEGYLFPDTYLLPKEASVSSVVRILEGTFEQKYATLVSTTSLSKKQTVTLASLVEREAKHQEDRPIIAGILLKRLKKGWPLQVDAAAQYIRANAECKMQNAKCEWWPQVSKADLELASLYNTYENLGLPPAPICNPGLASLKAVANPQESEYWYYLADTSGKTYYAKTLEEHEENIEKYLQ